MNFQPDNKNMNMNHLDVHEFRKIMQDLSDDDISGVSLPSSLLLRREGRFQTYYAPFESINPAARLVLVGLTPGLQQASNALRVARDSLRAGIEPVEAARLGKATGAFSGPMRTNLVAMLDHIGLPRVLGIPSTTDLFSVARSLLQSTSVLRYPVLIDGKNYGGTPSPVRTAHLREMVEMWFEAEARKLPTAIFLPLGAGATEAVEHLVRRGAIERQRVLFGLPHPSGASAERIMYFLGRKDRLLLSIKTNAEKLDRAKAGLLQSIAALSDGLQHPVPSIGKN